MHRRLFSDIILGRHDRQIVSRDMWNPVLGFGSKFQVSYLGD